MYISRSVREYCSPLAWMSVLSPVASRPGSEPIEPRLSGLVLLLAGGELSRAIFLGTAGSESGELK